MKSIKFLVMFLLLLNVNNLNAQDNDFFELMGKQKSEILKSSWGEYEKIITGDYYKIGFAPKEDISMFFYFDNDLKCTSFRIQKNITKLENAKLILSSDFPNKGTKDGMLFYWNSRMLATIVTDETTFVVIYKKRE